MNNINIINEIHNHLDVYEIAQTVENLINNDNYNFEIIDNHLLVTDNATGETIKILSNEDLKYLNIKDIEYNIKVAILINEIKVSYNNYCLDDEQIDAMLNIVNVNH